MFSLADFLDQNQPKNGRFFTIAIDGRGGSGKSALTEYLQERYPKLTMIKGDDYFEPVQDDVMWGEFNERRFLEDVIEPLQEGNSFQYKNYDWHEEAQT
jgi:uridine kinase